MGEHHGTSGHADFGIPNLGVVNCGGMLGAVRL